MIGVQSGRGGSLALMDHGGEPLRSLSLTEQATHEPTLLLRDETLQARRATIEQWGVALGQGDDKEVDRLVQKSRAARVETATSGLMGTMIGRRSSTTPSGAVG